MKLTQAHSPTLQQQHGLALISALLALMVIAIIGVALGSGGALFRKATVAQEDQTTSLTAAESLLVAVERSINYSQVHNPDELNPEKSVTGLYTTVRSKSAANDCNGEGWWTLTDCWNNTAQVITMGSGDNRLLPGGSLEKVNFDLKTKMGLTQQPRVRIEVDRTNAGLRPLNAGDDVGGLRLYQITVHSTGRGEAETFLRSIYGVMENTIN